MLAHFFKRGTKGEGLDAKPVTVTNLSTFQPFNHSTNYPSRLTLHTSRLTPHSSRKCAFTLAEVLITLGIIGVVAALVIPNLISNYEKKVIETGIAKTYSELASIIKQSEADNGFSNTWSLTNDSKKFVNQYIAPYVHLTECKSHNGNGKQPCFAGSDGNFYVWRYSWTEQLSIGGAHRVAPKYLFDDGRSLMVMAIEPWGVGRGWYVYFVVDVNGRRGKSIIGVDVFAFTYVVSSSKLNAGGFRNYTSEDIIARWCNPTLKPDMFECGVLLERNNWKFPKNYPIKF